MVNTPLYPVFYYSLSILLAIHEFNVLRTNSTHGMYQQKGFFKVYH